MNTEDTEGTEPNPKVWAKSNSVPQPTKKENATLEQRIKILDWYYKNGKNQSATAKHFDKKYLSLNLKQPLLSKWVKKEEYWRKQWQDSCASRENVHQAKHIRQTLHPEVTEMMELWVSKAMQNNVLLTGEVLRQKWKQFADLAGVPEDEWLNLSDGWLTRFKTRNGLRQIKQHGEAGSADPEHVAQERQRVQELIQGHGYHLKDIFNMDETGLFYAYVYCVILPVLGSHTDRLPPDRGLADKRRSGRGG